MTHFSEKLVSWFEINKRDLPWRHTHDPYKIWLSEIILQQTRVVQGMEYYISFVNQYPTVKHLAAASEDQVLKLWQGLGYYSRARNLHFTAKTIVENYNGIFPDKFTEILKLKGIGEYTAAAISSFAYNEPQAVVDGNVMRVLSRIFDIQLPIDSTEGKKMFSKTAFELLDKKNPATHNQAIMEFGALHCKPVSPDCVNCIFTNECMAYKNSLVEMLPFKAKTMVQKKRYFVYLNIHDNHRLLIRKRTDKDIWKGLYEFPLIVLEEGFDDLISKIDMILGDNSEHKTYKIENISDTFEHVLTHQRIYAKFVDIHVTDFANFESFTKPYSKVDQKELSTFAVSRLMEKYLEKTNDKNSSEKLKFQ